MPTSNCSELSNFSNILLSVRLSSFRLESSFLKRVEGENTFCRSFHSQHHFHKCF
ncbi:unnamed protein product [Hymenolepis diminuta]|uniref:Uncharacterized protein n=1 Tax=Hymenolepis diminuta TaxID=6216 RepID=A0A564YW51_HYMDI|nr:unnamed protein product [Hymenolepis diminuta]VUZ51475.1 unnamed protein product [Hymenolepis diminuta]